MAGVTNADEADRGLPPVGSPPASVSSLGLLRAFRTDILGAFSADFYTELRVPFRRFGHRFVCFNDPDDISHVLNTHMRGYRTNILGRRLLEPIVGQGIIFAEGEEWRRQHNQLAPFFQARSLERLVPSFDQVAEAHMGDWPRDKAFERDLLLDFRRLTIAVIARTLLSIDDEALTSELADFASHGESAGALLDWRDCLALLFGDRIPQPPKRLAFAARWREWVEALVAARSAQTGLDGVDDMLSILSAPRDGGSPAPMTEIVGQVGTMLSAGFITTAIALFWTTLLLARFPAHQEAIRRELCAGEVGAPAQWSMIRASRLTTAFVYETLRLFPPVYVIAREAREHDNVGDFHVSRGTAAIISAWTTHRHEKLWRHPSQFDPSRFLKKDHITTPSAWMPFGVGPRVCIATAFATAEIIVILRHLLSRYQVELAGPAPRPVGRVTLTPEFAPRFRLTPIE